MGRWVSLGLLPSVSVGFRSSASSQKCVCNDHQKAPNAIIEAVSRSTLSDFLPKALVAELLELTDSDCNCRPLAALHAASGGRSLP